MLRRIIRMLPLRVTAFVIGGTLAAVEFIELWFHYRGDKERQRRERCRPPDAGWQSARKDSRKTPEG
jgi:hypothetical protein